MSPQKRFHTCIAHFSFLARILPYDSDFFSCKYLISKTHVKVLFQLSCAYSVLFYDHRIGSSFNPGPLPSTGLRQRFLLSQIFNSSSIPRRRFHQDCHFSVRCLFFFSGGVQSINQSDGQFGVSGPTGGEFLRLSIESRIFGSVDM
jgi:hypothetical protein